MHEYGTPGGSLDATRNRTQAQFASSAGAARSGREGELECARLLADTFQRDANVAVLHDLRLPGYKANIDHAVVRGSTVVLIDAKKWKPGWYWTLGGKTRRGRERIEWADNATMPAAARVVAELVAAGASKDASLRDVTVTTAVVVFPAGEGKMRLWAYRPSGGTSVHASRGAGRWIKGMLGRDTQLNGALVELLRRLVIDQQAGTLHGQVRMPAVRR